MSTTGPLAPPGAPTLASLVPAAITASLAMPRFPGTRLVGVLPAGGTTLDAVRVLDNDDANPIDGAPRRDGRRARG